jgi:Zn-dependent protease with chaperone function
VPGDLIDLSLQTTVLSGSVIAVSDGALAKLTPAELEAGIAHELGHYYDSPWKVRLVGLISCLFMIPRNMLLAPMDLIGREYRADAYAVRLTGKPDALISLIGKIEAQHWNPFQATMKDRQPVYKRAGQALLYCLKSLDMMFFCARMPGFTHPPVAERIKSIREVSGMKGMTQPM